ncbi:unnamed protein product [Meganyctiphanes norvegica]|uniref:Uncharacterized protein n=1 Tax=Meganyctiphanes norvegica TaxID=48144 RepID=A0AAV2SJD0_MEGNR
MYLGMSDEMSLGATSCDLTAALGRRISLSLTAKMEMEELMCVVCREEYNGDHRVPVMLPHCGHTFCRPCTTHLINNTQGPMFCPTCRKRHRAHYGELPINYALLGLVEKTKKSKYGSCRKHGNPLEFWCCHCPEALCGHCLYEGHMGHGDDVIMAHELVEEVKKEYMDKGNKYKEMLKEQKGSQLKQVFSCVIQLVMNSTVTHNLEKVLKKIENEADLENFPTSNKELEMIESALESLKLTVDDHTDPMAVTERRFQNVFKPPSPRERQNSIMSHLPAPQSLTRDPRSITGPTSFTGCSAPPPSVPPMCCSFTSGDGRHARMRWEEGRIHLYALTEDQHIPGIMMHMSMLQHLLPKDNPEVFLELGAGNRSLGRVYIQLRGRTRNAQQFFSLCLGTTGPSYRGARFYGMPWPQHHRQMHSLTCREYMSENIPRTEPLMEGLAENIDNQVEMCLSGLVARVDDTGFEICTRDEPDAYLHNVLGEVMEGMSIVREAANHEPVSEVYISQCGVVIPSN